MNHRERGQGQGKDAPEVMDGFARRKETSKKRIRQAASTLFSQFGVEKVSITDIARKASVSPATIYNNFDGKETLVREFVTTVIEQFTTRIQDALTPDMPYRAKMATFVQFISEIVAHAGRSVVDETVFTSSQDLLNAPKIKEIRSAAQEKAADLLWELVQEGKEQGEVDPKLSEEAFRIYVEAFISILSDPRQRSRFINEPKVVQDLGVLILYGLNGGNTNRQEP